MRVTSSNIDDVINDIERRNLNPIEEIRGTDANPPLYLNNGWNDKNESVLIKLGEHSAAYKWMHEKSYTILNTISTVLNTFLVLIGTALSAESVVVYDGTGTVHILKTIGIYTVTVLTVVLNFLKLDERSFVHKTQCIKFLEIYQDIQGKMSMYRRDRPDAQVYSTGLLKKYDNLILTGPDISGYIIRLYKNAFKSATVDTLHPIEAAAEATTVEIQDSTLQNQLGQLSGLNQNVSLRDINHCMQLHGDITDKNVETMDPSVIRKLNNYYIDKQSQYQYERFMNLE